ncbi:MAG TPA: SDR family NAD(P)-dependent oxidoreductase [Candidatus Nanopelagicales bacterium]|jgi:2-deoxy-D-gluconate 3-dehydrogenase
MSFRLDDKVALVTGASRGIGRAIALAYADAGADVALLARDAELLEQVAVEVRDRGRRALVVAADVLDAAAVAAAVATSVDELGHLDVVVNNAGGNSFSTPLQTMRFAGWAKTQALNVDSVVHVCQSAIPHLTASGGSIINVASVAGLRGAPLMSHYGAAKAAVLSLTQSLALELAYQGVRVNALVPGWIETDLTDFLRSTDEIEKGLLSRVPMGRWGTAQEIAEPAVFLASDAARFVTGQALVVDGGLSAMP